MTSTISNVQPKTTGIVNLDLSDVTALVDSLFERTRKMMTANISNTEIASSAGKLHHHHHHSIAYSGGIDSSLVAALVYRTSADLQKTVAGQEHPHDDHTVTAVLGVSPAVSAEQIQSAEQIASYIGVPFVMIPTNEGSQEMYIANTGQACYACKSELYHTLIHHTIAKYHDSSTPIKSVHTQQPHYNLLYNGTNADDCLDPTRVGLVAAAKYNVLSPLDHVTKQQVRMVSKHIGLPNWNVAANPCLRSRLALGVPATREHLQRIELAERFVRQQLWNKQHDNSTSSGVPISVETNLRVRLLAQQRACIEIDTELVKDITDIYHTHQKEWDELFVKELQFSSLTIRPFRSGSVASSSSSVNAV
jgi:pyridinium-3,5-biscarboxylic acid mononucleotide sulfurtransferase